MLRFEELTTRVSSKLIAATCQWVDREVENALAEIRCFFTVDRCGLLAARPGRDSFRIIHAGVGEDTPLIPLHVDLSHKLFPWCYQKLFEQQEVISIETLDDLPSEAAVDKQTCRDWSIRSFLNIPIVLDGTAEYVISLNAVQQERDWPEELTRRLSLLGGILVNALERRKKAGKRRIVCNLRCSCPIFRQNLSTFLLTR